MKLPAIEGVIKRRLLLNYRVDPDVAERLLPTPFRPKLVGGFAIAGVCLIRLEKIRPKGLPSLLGMASENAASRISVEWEDQDGVTREGVFVPRRDTDSLLNHKVGAKLFGGVNHYADFTTREEEGRIEIEVREKGAEPAILKVRAVQSDQFPDDSVFSSLEEASQFFEKGCLGYSARPDSPVLDGLTLKVAKWEVSPLRVEEISSAYFEDHELFSPSSIAFDHGLLMRDLIHEWHSEVSPAWAGTSG